jgi:16S rRNA processing protein RimM
MKYIPIGRVVSPHGIRGEVKFKYYNEVQEGISFYTSFFAFSDNKQIILKPEIVKHRNGFFYILFEGFNNPEEVSFLTKKELSVCEEDLPQLPGNEYYEYQLIGLEVLNHRSRKIGKVAEILHTKANDVLVIKGKKEMLIPMVEEYIAQINIKDSYIKITENALFP